MVQQVLGFGGKPRKNIIGFCIGGFCCSLPSYLQCLFPDSPHLFFCQKHHFYLIFYNTFLQSPQVSPVPSTLLLFSLLRLQEEAERSYNLDKLQRYCFQFYKFHLYQHRDHLPSTTDRWQSEVQPSLRLQQAWLLKGRLSRHLRCPGSVLGHKCPLRLRLKSFPLYVILINSFHLQHITYKAG